MKIFFIVMAMLLGSSVYATGNSGNNSVGNDAGVNSGTGLNTDTNMHNSGAGNNNGTTDDNGIDTNATQ